MSNQRNRLSWAEIVRQVWYRWVRIENCIMRSRLLSPIVVCGWNDPWIPLWRMKTCRYCCQCLWCGERKTELNTTSLLYLSLFLPISSSLLPHLPNTKSMKKKSTANNCGNNLNFAIASGYEMKAKPAPPFTTFDMSLVFVSNARLPSIPKMTQPASIEVHESIVVTIMTSLWWKIVEVIF